MKPRSKNKRGSMNIIGGGLSTDIINKALKMVQEIEATTQKNTLISNIGSKMKTAGFVPAFLDGSFKSDYVDFQVEFGNPALKGITISVKNLKYNLSFKVILSGTPEIARNDLSQIQNVNAIFFYKFDSDSEKIEDFDTFANVSVTDLGSIMNKLESIYERMAKLYNDALLKEIQKEAKEEREQEKQKDKPKQEEQEADDQRDEDGEEGEDGDGEDGEDGEDGDGEDGEDGEDGDEEDGEDGEDGDGEDGEDGDGEDGEDGDGEDGEDGEDGDGEDGEDGDGEDGEDGEEGDGEDGEDGDGEDGEDGEDGDGEDGEDGDGEDGEDGDGEDGEDGEDGDGDGDGEDDLTDEEIDRLIESLNKREGQSQTDGADFEDFLEMVNKGEIDNDFTENYKDPRITSPQRENTNTNDPNQEEEQQDYAVPQITGSLQALAMFSNFANQEDFINSLQGSKTTLNALINGLSQNEVTQIKTLLGNPELSKFEFKQQANQDFDIINNTQP